jgi:hypothetical protein
MCSLSTADQAFRTGAIALDRSQVQLRPSPADLRLLRAAAQRRPHRRIEVRQTRRPQVITLKSNSLDQLLSSDRRPARAPAPLTAFIARCFIPITGLLYPATLINPRHAAPVRRYLEASCTCSPCLMRLAHLAARRGGAPRVPSSSRWASPLSQQAYSPRPTSHLHPRRPRPVRGSAPPPPPISASKR